MNVDDFNRLYPVGTPVFAYPGARPEGIPSARRLVTRTRTAAQLSCSGDPVVWVEDEGSYICLTHVDPVAESAWQAAKQAEETAVVAAEGALPVPVGPGARTVLDRARNAVTARMTKDDLRLALENVITYADGLRARIAELETASQQWGDRWRDRCDHIAKQGLRWKAEAEGRKEHGEKLQARIAELEEQRDRRRDRLVALQNDALAVRGSLAPADGDRKVPFELGETLTPAVDWLIARVAELEAERHTTNEALSDAAEQLRANRDRINELEKVTVEARAALGSLCYDLEDPGTAALGALYLLSRATVWTEAENGPDFAADALAQRDAKVLREAQARIEKLEDELVVERLPYRERAEQETSPARRAAWLQLAATDEADAS